MRKRIRRIIIRIIFIIILILLGIFLYTIGKEHKVFIDNSDIFVGDITYTASAAYTVLVDNQEIGLIEKGERKVVKVTGVSHKIVIEEIKDNILTGEKYEKIFTLKTKETATINILAIINNTDKWIDKKN